NGGVRRREEERKTRCGKVSFSWRNRSSRSETRTVRSGCWRVGAAIEAALMRERELLVVLLQTPLVPYFKSQTIFVISNTCVKAMHMRTHN
ncbi:hypothetical protein GBAR_LOCUS20374, partial [Geodia barretti]